MKTVIKYSNRKLYDKEESKYINLKELLSLPLGTFQVVEKNTGNDVTVETLFSYLANHVDSIEDNKDIKLKIMQHCISVLSIQ